MNVVPFQFEGKEVRTVMRDGDPWFVAADVCAVLELAKVDSALRGLDADEKGTHIVSTPGGSQRVSIISEPGLYALVSKSRKPEAKRFDRWVRHEVLPSIRKTGAYRMPAAAQEKSPVAAISVDLCFAQAFIGTFKVCESSKLSIFKKIGDKHGADTSYLPVYAVDAPAGSSVDSSEATAPLTELIKARGVRISAREFNLILERAGYLRQCERKTTSKRFAHRGGVKPFWTITEAGLAFGKNIVSPESPRETVPHWFVSKFDELRATLRPLYRSGALH